MAIHRWLFGLGIGLLLGARAAAADPATWAGDPDPRIDSLFTAVSGNATPGCAIEMLRDGRAIYTRGYGMASVELGVPLSPGTVYDIGSVSKQFTALVILMLADEHRLALDDDVRKYVPELPAYRVPVRIHHLLNQTSGLRDYVELFPLAGVQYESVVSPADALALLSRQRAVNFSAGDEWSYSNTNYCLLAVIAERVSGVPFDRLLAQRIFEPLGMTSTSVVRRYDQIVPHKAASYFDGPDSGFVTANYHWQTEGDGAIQSTLADLARWDENFYAPRVGTASMLAAMQQPGVLNDGTPTRYGFGLLLRTFRGLRLVSHNGFAAGFMTDFARFPDQHFSVITACNCNHQPPFGIFARVANLELADAVAPPPVPAHSESLSAADTRDLAGHAGRYFSEQTGEVQDLAIAGGKVTLVRGGAPLGLSVLGPDHLAWTPGHLDVRLHHGAGTGGTWLGEAIDQTQAARLVPVADTVHVDARAAEAFVGTYASTELNTTWRIALQGERLVLRRSGLSAKDVLLNPLFPDGYEADIANLRFERDRAGRVTGLRAWTRGVRGILLTRARS